MDVIDTFDIEIKSIRVTRQRISSVQDDTQQVGDVYIFELISRFTLMLVLQLYFRKQFRIFMKGIEVSSHESLTYPIVQILCSLPLINDEGMD